MKAILLVLACAHVVTAQLSPGEVLGAEAVEMMLGEAGTPPLAPLYLKHVAKPWPRHGAAQQVAAAAPWQCGRDAECATAFTTPGCLALRSPPPSKDSNSPCLGGARPAGEWVLQDITARAPTQEQPSGIAYMSGQVVYAQVGARLPETRTACAGVASRQSASLPCGCSAEGALALLLRGQHRSEWRMGRGRGAGCAWADARRCPEPS